jgi:hypothetical protein
VARALRPEPRSRARAAWRLAAAYAMVFVLLVGTYAASIRHERLQKLEEMRAEHQRIESDLRQVKAIADEAQPIVVLENGDTHVIVDLKQKQESIYY